MHPSLDDNICIPSLLRKAVQSIVRGAGAEGDGRRCVDLLNSEVQLAASLLDYVRTRWTAADSQIEDVTHAEALHILLLVDSIKQRAALLYIEYVQSGCMVGAMVSSCIAEIRVMLGLICPTLSESSSSHDISMLHSIGEACIGPLFDVPCSERSVHSFVVCSKLLPTIIELLHHFRELCPASLMAQHIDIIDSMFFVQWDPAVLLPVVHILSDMYSHLTSQHRRDLRTRLMDAASQPLSIRGGGDSTGLLMVTLRLLEQGCDPSWMHVVRVLYRRSCFCGAGDRMEVLWERALSRSDYAAQLLLCAMEDAAVQCGEILSSRPRMSMSPSIQEDHFVDTVPSISHSDVCLALLISRALKTSRGCSDQCANEEIELPMLISSVTTDDDYETICQSQHHARTIFVLLLACSAPQMMMTQPKHRLSEHLSGASSVSRSRLGDIVQHASNDLVAITCSNNSSRDGVTWMHCSRSRELFEMLSLLGAYPSIAEECLEKVTGWTTATDTTTTRVLHDEHRSVGCLLRECMAVLFQAVEGTRTAITAAVLRGIICECAASRSEDGLSSGDVGAKASSSREQAAAAAAVGPAQALLSLFSSLLLQLCRSFPLEIASSHAAFRSCLDSLDSVQASIAHLVLSPLVPLCLHSTDLFEWLLGVASRAARDTAMDRQLLAIRTLVPMLFTVDECLYIDITEPLSCILYSSAALCSELYTQLLYYLDSSSPPTSSVLGTLKRLVDGQLAASFSSSTHRTSLSLDSDRPNMDADYSIRMQHLFDPARHMKRSTDRWVFSNDIRQLIVLSGRVEYCLHGCRYVDPFVRYVLHGDDVSRAELTESHLLIAAMRGIVECIRWGSGTPHDGGGTVDGMLSKRGSPLSTTPAQCLDRVAGLVCTYAALDAVIYCVVQSEMTCAGDDDDDAAARRDASEALFALSSIADVLINVLAHKTNDEIASHDSCLRSYQSRLGGMADTEHRLPVDLSWFDGRPLRQQLYSHSRTIVAPSMQSLTRILRNCTTRLLSIEGRCWLSSAAGVLSWPYSLQCGVFNYWSSYVTQQMNQRGTVEDPSISEGGDADSASMELLHQLEASYRSVCQIAQEEHWMVFHQTKHQQFLSFVRSAAAERHRYNMRVRIGRRRSCRDTRSDDMDEEDVDSSSSEGELGIACPLKGFVLSPSETISPSATSRIVRDSAHRIVYDCFTNLLPSDRKRISGQCWDLSQWVQCMETRGTDERHAVSGEEDVAAWGAVKQAIRATLDMMRCQVLNAIASVLRSVRCIKSSGSSSTDELGTSSSSDPGLEFLQQSELFSSEILEAVKDGTTARTFNAYVGVLNCLWDRLVESRSALPSAVGRTLMMVLHHLTAPHKLIVRAVLALAFKFLGTETSLQQIEYLICSMTTDGGDECCDSAGYEETEQEGRVHPKVVDCILKELLDYVSTVLRDSTVERSICDSMKRDVCLCSGAFPSASPRSNGVRALMSLFTRSPHSPRHTAVRCLSPQEGNDDDDASVLRIDSISDHRTLQVLDMLVRVMNHCNRECLAISKLTLHLRKVTNLAHRSVVKRRNAFDGFRDPFNDDDDDDNDDDNDDGGEDDHEDEEVHRDELDHHMTSIARLAAVDTRVSCCFVSALFSVPIDVLVEMQLWLIRRCTTSRKQRRPKLGGQSSSAQLLVFKRSSLALNKLDALQLNLFTILSEIDKPYQKIPQEDMSPVLSDLLIRTYSSEVLAALQVVDVQGRQVLDALQQSNTAGSSSNSGKEGKQRQKMRSPDVADNDDDECGSDSDASTSDQVSADGSSQMKAVADVDRMIEESRRHTYMVGNRRVNTMSPVNIARLGSPRPTSSISLSGSASRPATKRLRSRNSVIDAWLHEEDGTDAYADLEGFLV